MSYIVKSSVALAIMASVSLSGCSIEPDGCKEYTGQMDHVAGYISSNDPSDKVIYGAMKFLEEELPAPKFTSLAVLAGQYADVLESGNQTRPEKTKLPKAFLKLQRLSTLNADNKLILTQEITRNKK